MKRKILLILLSIISVVCLAFGLSACNSESGSNEGEASGGSYSSSEENSSSNEDNSQADSWYSGVYSVNTAYTAAQQLGYSGTLEDFIASISGTDGADGIGISTITLSINGELVITLSNNSKINLGKITGEDGSDGQDGTVWYTGTGVPSATAGKNGDMYLDTQSYDIYLKNNGSWVKTCNIKGTDGEDGNDGQDGTVWYTGTGAPSGETGANGDIYLDTESYDIYLKVDGAWAMTGNIKGADGNNGDDGVGISSVTTNSEGKLVITLTNGNYYEFDLPSAETTATEYTLTYEENDSGYTVTGVSDKSVTEIEIPEEYNGKTVTAIGSNAFANCYYLSEITIPESVVSIGDYAFCNCTMLESIVLPENVTSMGKGVLYGCNYLQSLTFSFNYTNTKAEAIYLGYLFGGNHYNYSRSSNASLVPLSLTSVTIKGTTIPEYALSSCYYIENVIIENTITTICDYAFSWCESIESIVISDNVTYIGDCAFIRCHSIESIVIPKNVTYIGDNAFFYCTALENITINSTNISLGSDSFSGTGYYSNTANWEDGALYLATCLISLQPSLTGSYTIKDGTTTICGSLTSHSYITEIIIPNSVTYIGNYSFSNFLSLTSITIPNSVTYIGIEAFDGCTALECVTFEDTEGWYVTQTANAESGDTITLTDASANADYLTDTYHDYYWYKTSQE